VCPVSSKYALSIDIAISYRRALPFFLTLAQRSWQRGVQFRFVVLALSFHASFCAFFAACLATLSPHLSHDFGNQVPFHGLILRRSAIFRHFWHLTGIKFSSKDNAWCASSIKEQLVST